MICFGGIWGVCEERGECQWGSTTQTHGDEWYLHLCTTGLGVLGRIFWSDYTRHNKPFSVKSLGGPAVDISTRSSASTDTCSNEASHCKTEIKTTKPLLMHFLAQTISSYSYPESYPCPLIPSA